MSGNIKSFRIYEEPKYDKDNDLISGGNIINVKATPEGWSKYKTAYGLVDFEKREKLTPPPSSTKPAAEKPKGEYKITMQYKGATYGRNSEKDQWVKIK